MILAVLGGLSINFPSHQIPPHSMLSQITPQHLFCRRRLQLAATTPLTFPTPFNSSQTSSYPKPEQAIQYYRASSVVLTLDGYNNTVALGANPSAAPIPLPSNIDVQLMTCINQTIGSSVPLIGGVSSSYAPSNLMLVCLLWILWYFGDL